MSKTGIIWSRVSTSEQELGYSLDQQIDLLRRAAKEEEIEILEAYRICETGSRSEKRKHFKGMIDFVFRKKIKYILAFKIDRLARNYHDFFDLQKLVDKGVSIFIINDNRIYSRNSPSSERFHFRLMGNVAQLEAEQIGERTALGMKTKLHAGEIVWEAPIGYRNAPSDSTGHRRTVVVDEERAPLVKKGFELYATGSYSLGALTEELNRSGLTSKPGKRRPSGPVSRNCVQKFLKNRFYIGEFWDKKTSVWRKHSYPLFIEKSVFDRVQRRMKDKTQSSKGKRDHLTFFFKPFLRCGFCGAQITAYEPKPGFIYYDCSQSHVKYNGGKRCPKSSIYPERKIDQIFSDAIGRLYIDENIADRIRRHLSEDNERDEAAIRRERRRLLSRITERTNHLDLIYEDRLNGKITVEEYGRYKEKIQNEIADTQLRLDSLIQRNFDYKDQGSTILELLKGFKGTYLSENVEGKSQILGTILRECKLRGTEADIVWKEPFETLFSMGELVLKSKEWGE